MGPATLTVDLVRREHDEATSVRLLDTEVGRGGPAFLRLDQSLAVLARKEPGASGEIHAWADVPHQEVIRAIDSFAQAGITDLTFVGTPPPRR